MGLVVIGLASAPRRVGIDRSSSSARRCLPSSTLPGTPHAPVSGGRARACPDLSKSRRSPPSLQNGVGRAFQGRGETRLLVDPHPFCEANSQATSHTLPGCSPWPLLLAVAPATSDVTGPEAQKWAMAAFQRGRADPCPSLALPARWFPPSRNPCQTPGVHSRASA